MESLPLDRDGEANQLFQNVTQSVSVGLVLIRLAQDSLDEAGKFWQGDETRADSNDTGVDFLQFADDAVHLLFWDPAVQAGTTTVASPVG